MENHVILGGKVQLYQRADSSFWWCATRLGGKQRRTSTKKESLKLAEDVATDWYLTLQGKVAARLRPASRSMCPVANALAAFLPNGSRARRMNGTREWSRR